MWIFRPSLENHSTRRAAHAVAWVVLAMVGLALLIQSHPCWGDPIIDLGRDLYLPSQIIAGRVLYRHLIYNYGPAAPYILAGVVAVFGDALQVFATVGILCGVATMAALYAIGVYLGGVLCGFTSALFFLVLNFFANTTWGCNFVLPYSYAAVVATPAAMWSFYFLLRYLYDGRQTLHLVASVLPCYATLLSKQDIGLAIAAVHVVAWYSHRVSWRAILTVSGGGLCLFLFLVLTFQARSPVEHAVISENLSRFLPFVGQGLAPGSPFFRRVAGLDKPLHHLGEALNRLFVPVATVLMVYLLTGIREVLRRRQWRLLIATFILALVLPRFIWTQADGHIFRGSYLASIILWPTLVILRPRDPLVLLSAFVLFSGLRIPLKYDPYWYGFYLCVPVYPFTTYLLGVRVPRFLTWRCAAVAAFSALALVILIRFEIATHTSFRERGGTLVTPKGIMRDPWVPGRPQAIEAFLTYIRHREPRPRSMVVFPEGVTLNYFTDIQNPTAYYIFTPPEVSSPQVEERMVNELRAAAPDCVVVVTRDVREFGRSGFGVDYALAIRAWIEENYTLECVFTGPEQTNWRLWLLRRAIKREKHT